MRSVFLILVMSLSAFMSACNQVEIDADAFKKSRLVGSASTYPPVLDPLNDEAVSEANPVTTIDLNDSGDDIDQDGNILTYSCVFETNINGVLDSPVSNCTSLPGVATFNPSTGVFNWTSNYASSGTYEVWFTATDGYHTDRVLVTYTITNVNRAPVLDAIPTSITSDVSVAITTINLNDGGNDTDIDGTALTYSCLFDETIDGTLTLPGTSCTSLGGSVSFNSTTGVFNWTPNAGASGAYELFFSGSDGFLTDTKAVAITVADLSLGDFAILGVTGGADVTQDNKLNFTTYPVINWAASAGAANYDVKIFAADGVTAIGCGSTTAVSGTSYNFSTCSLTPGTDYKVRVIARAASGGGKNSTNDLYSFKLNSLPVAVNDGPFYILASGNLLINVLSDNIASAAYDPDSDPDGDTISHASKSNGGKGTTTYVGAAIRYTATAGQSGMDTFTYTITDGKGGSATGTVTVYIISGYSWIGAVNSDWNNPGNWCGSINATNTSCSGGSTLPGITDTVNFNGGCINCNVNINTNVDVARINMDSSFTGSIAQNNYTVKVRTSYLQMGGTFTGGSANIDVTDSMQILNGTFTSTSAELKIFHDQGCCGQSTNNFVVNAGATFNHNNGTVKVASSTSNGTGHNVTGFEINAPGVSFFNLITDSVDVDAAGGLVNSMTSVKSGTTINVVNSLTNVDGKLINGRINISGNAIFTCTSASICADGGGDGGYFGTELYFNGAFPMLQTIEVHGAAVVPSITIAGTSTVTVASDTNDITFHGHFKQTDGVFNAPSGWMHMETRSYFCCSDNPEGFRILGGTFNSNGTSLRFSGSNANTAGGTPHIGTVSVPLGFTVRNFIYDHYFDNTGSHWFFGASVFNITEDFTFSDGYIDGTPSFYVGGDVTFNCDILGPCAENSPGRIYFTGNGLQVIHQQTGAGMLLGTWTINKPSGIVGLASNFVLNGNGQGLDLQAGQLDMNGFSLSINDGAPSPVNLLSMGPNTVINQGSGSLSYEGLVKDPTATINP